MVAAKNQATAAAPSETSVVVLPAGTERRRPGRQEHVDPALIPLLRYTPDPHATLPAFDLEGDRLADLDPFRGIMIGLVVSAVIWVGGVTVVALILS